MANNQQFSIVLANYRRAIQQLWKRPISRNNFPIPRFLDLLKFYKEQFPNYSKLLEPYLQKLGVKECRKADKYHEQWTLLIFLHLGNPSVHFQVRFGF